MTEHFQPHIVKQHQIGIYTYGSIDRDRAAFIQAIAEKDAQNSKLINDAKTES